MQVDMIMFETYENINVDETPIIVLECNHVKTVESLDGIVGLNDFYAHNGQDWTGVLNCQDKSDAVPVCPDCRCPITGIFRYRRVLNHAILSISEKKY